MYATPTPDHRVAGGDAVSPVPCSPRPPSPTDRRPPSTSVGFCHLARSGERRPVTSGFRLPELKTSTFEGYRGYVDRLASSSPGSRRQPEDLSFIFAIVARWVDAARRRLPRTPPGCS